MSIKQIAPITGISLIGDGTTTAVSIDLTNYIRPINTLPNTPSGVYTVSATSGVTVSTYSISGNILNVTFTTAPSNGLIFGLGIQLVY